MLFNAADIAPCCDRLKLQSFTILYYYYYYCYYYYYYYYIVNIAPSPPGAGRYYSSDRTLKAVSGHPHFFLNIYIL